MFKKGIDLLTSQMKGEWPRVPVSDIATAVIGGTPRRSVAEYWDGNLPWATAKDVARVPSRYLDEVQENITEAGLESSTTKLMPAGTVVITARGTVGALAQLRREMAFNQTCYAILPGDSINNNFLFYALKGTIAEMRALTYGTVFDTITRRTFDDWLLPLPPLTEQRAIAHILGTLDDKIELNRRMNETLEEMARAIFKSWFVDFDPVRAKMDGSWRRGESLPGMPAEMYDLFPSRLVDSELGEIPEGWGVGIVGDCFHLTMGQSPPGRTYNDEGDGLPFFQGCSDFGFRYPTNRRFCTAPTRIAESEDTLVSVRAPVGDINKAWERCCIGRGLAALQHKSGSPSFTYYLVWAIQQEIQQYEHTGTVFGAINKKQFKALKTVEPKLAAVDLFETFVLPLDERIRLNVSESRTLSGLRDTLLPKLISGELRVRNAEGFVEGTA